MEKQIKAILVGAGYRADIYASYSLQHPEKLNIVGIVEPDAVRRSIMREKYGVPEHRCYESVEQLVREDVFADAVINGTMDHLHVSTSIPLLQKGYDMLLEKPIAVNEEEMNELLAVANRCRRKVYICHVLRYTPFYSSIKKHLLAGEIGDIIGIEMSEHVNYAHMAVSYVRGKWRSEKVCHATMLLAKSCHDIDLMMWMMEGTSPASVVSYGSDLQFTADKKPAGAGSRCLSDCPYNKECRFSAEANYLVHSNSDQYVWKCLEADADQSEEHKIESLKTTNPYGKCVWDFERDGNVDHQMVIVNFKNGATGMFSMMGGTAKSERSIHIIGTKGEIEGDFETKKYVVRHIAPYTEAGYETEEYDFHGSEEQEGANSGGAEGLIADFVDCLCGKEPSISCTELNHSIISHRVVFRAERSRKNQTTESLQ